MCVVLRGKDGGAKLLDAVPAEGVPRELQAPLPLILALLHLLGWTQQTSPTWTSGSWLGLVTSGFRVGSGLVSGWFRVGFGLVQGWFRVGSGLVPGRLRVGSGLVQGWFRVQG